MPFDTTGYTHQNLTVRANGTRISSFLVHFQQNRAPRIGAIVSKNAVSKFLFMLWVACKNQIISMLDLCSFYPYEHCFLAKDLLSDIIFNAIGPIKNRTLWALNGENDYVYEFSTWTIRLQFVLDIGRQTIDAIGVPTWTREA